MTRTIFFTVLLLAAQVFSLPVTNPTTKDDTKVMKCIVEVISDTVSKPNPLPLSQECLEVLQGDERILSILRHQNLLKELQEIAIQGESERTEQQKKNSGFEDELSEVLESQSNKNTGRDLFEGAPEEEPTASFAELEAEKSQKNRDTSREDERNSLEEMDPRAREGYPEDEKENFKSNEVGKREELSWDDAMDNHIHDDIREEEIRGQRHQEDEDAAGAEDMDEFEDEKEPISKNSQEEENEEIEDRVRDQPEEEEEEDEEQEEEERGTSEEEHPTSNENEDYQREDEDEDSKGIEKDEKPSAEKDKEKYRNAKGGRHHSLDETTPAEDTSHAKDADSEEMDEEPSKDLEDAKRWNKMDELAKQLTTAKRTEENESNEDPDRSMKLASRSHKYDFRNPEEDVRRPQKHHSKEESSEGGFPLVAVPEEKKDEEGSANRRTELNGNAPIKPKEGTIGKTARTSDQELESLAAIEAELENVAHKLHALRKA